MASPPSPNAGVERIITHMNNDHHDSLVRYLEHYNNISGIQARNARMTSFTLSHVGLSTSSGVKDTYLIPLDPPLKSFMEARDRLVAMDKECISALGRDEITVKEYKGARGFQIVVLIACLLTFVSFSRRANLRESTAAWPFNRLAALFPDFFAFCYRIQPLVLYPMLVVHVGEATYMDHSRLQKHSVTRGSRLWWQWVISTFLYGFGNFIEFDKIVKKAHQEKAAKKH